MYRIAIAATTAAILTMGISGCDQQETEQAREQIEKAVDETSDAVRSATETAGDKIEQWTDGSAADDGANKDTAREADRKRRASER
jgi:hypothetical protein